MNKTRTYFISNVNVDVDIDSNQITEISKVDLNNFKPYKLIDSYKITKKRYLSIFQILFKNSKDTYTEEYNIINQEKDKIIMKYKKNILDNNEFPSLNEYNFEETYDEEIYEIMYNNKIAKLVKNKFEMFIEE
jgi:hypothetical protein